MLVPLRQAQGPIWVPMVKMAWTSQIPEVSELKHRAKVSNRSSRMLGLLKVKSGVRFEEWRALKFHGKCPLDLGLIFGLGMFSNLFSAVS